MQFRDISFPKPEDNIAFDQALLQMAEKHEAGEYLRFWESPKVFIVLGLSGKPEVDVDLGSAQKEGVPVLKRFSGGGTVVQGPGCLNYTLVLSKQRVPELNDLHQSYTWISNKVIEALGKAGVEAYFRPLSDLATGKAEKKFSGNAQARRKHYILHHGTILYNFDLALISRYLKMPLDVPEYRKGRVHTDFVTNVSLDPQVFKKHLAQIFQVSALQAPTEQELMLLRG
jgi:lipoate-protein ligase A